MPKKRKYCDPKTCTLIQWEETILEKEDPPVQGVVSGQRSVSASSGIPVGPTRLERRRD